MLQIFKSKTAQRRLGPRVAAVLLLSAAFNACGDSEPTEVQCLPEPTTTCTPDINTDFASIQRSVFAPRCGTSGNACHGAAGRKGDLVLADPETAYKALLGQDGTQSRVIPGDPGCSPLLQRLELDNPKPRMPYGEKQLSEGLRCAVRMWIEDGAAR